MSLRDELNQAKVELTYEKEEKKDYSISPHCKGNLGRTTASLEG